MFNELKRTVLGNFDVKLNIVMKGETIAVSFTPTLKAGSDAKPLKSIIISGSADDLDANFFELIHQTFSDKAQLIYDVQAFSSSLEKAKKTTEDSAKKEVKKAEPAKPASKPKAKTTPEPVKVEETKPAEETPEELPLETKTVEPVKAETPEFREVKQSPHHPDMTITADRTPSEEGQYNVDDLFNDLGI